MTPRLLPSALAAIAVLMISGIVPGPANAATAEKMKAAPKTSASKAGKDAPKSPPPQRPVSKGEDINIGVGEEPGMQKSQKLKKK